VDRGPSGRLESINLSRGGVPKTAAAEATITATGLKGDRHRQRRYHGGPDRAVTLFSADRIAELQAEGHPIAAGTTGENLTVAGLDWTRVLPGSRLSVGEEVMLEITKYTTPCQTITGSLLGGDISRIAQKTHPGWSRVCARVIAGGRIRVGDPVALTD
jgi:MOSC domain-containing protein YiiM